MSISDITDIFSLFGQGFIVGAFFSGLAFMIGWFINLILSLVKSA